MKYYRYALITGIYDYYSQDKNGNTFNKKGELLNAKQHTQLMAYSEEISEIDWLLIPDNYDSNVFTAPIFLGTYFIYSGLTQTTVIDLPSGMQIQLPMGSSIMRI